MSKLRAGGAGAQPSFVSGRGVARKTLMLALLLFGYLIVTTLVDRSPLGTANLANDADGTSIPLKTGWREPSESAQVSPEFFANLDPLTERAGPTFERPTIVNLWATYCGPCREELPILQKFSASRKFDVVGVSRDFRLGETKKFLRRTGVSFPNVMDPEGRFAQDLVGRVMPDVLPVTLLVDKGVVVAVHIGPFKNQGQIAAARDFL